MSWSDPAWAELARLVTDTTGLAFPGSRQAAAESAMTAAGQRAGAASASDYLAMLRAGSASLQELVGELVNGETYFFRHREQFELLRSEILPELRARLKRELYIWCAGCASGEEAYSLAFAAARSARVDAEDYVLATDLSNQALASARAAVYGQWSMRGLEQELIDQLCERQQDSYVVREQWRRWVTFSQLNLNDAPQLPFPLSVCSMDLIFCRNLLIYLEEPVVQRVARCLHDALSPGGYLLTSPTDPPLWELAPFAVDKTSAGIVYRRSPQGPVRRSSVRRAAAPSAQRRAPVSPPALSGLPRQGVEGRSGLAAADRAALALAAGDWAQAAALTEALHDERSAVIHVRALANLRGTAEAELVCARATNQYTTSVELHHLHALLLLDLGRLEQAAAAERRVLFLDATVVMAHLVLGNIARR
ncbi:MAG TPA: protein-glutamate O-methyltransferase CheR [Polyangiaceae bacterium]|nr:protein-glutamate O-methyltransferase CheR [Polyangiaceae bacterium]